MSLYNLLSTQYPLILFTYFPIFKHSFAINTSDCNVQAPTYTAVNMNSILSFLPPAKYIGFSNAACGQEKNIVKEISWNSIVTENYR